jgi:hypothetical protein
MWARLETDRFHIIPVDDIKDHEDSSKCWCEPQILEGGLVVSHNAADGREFYEGTAEQGH